MKYIICLGFLTLTLCLGCIRQPDNMHSKAWNGISIVSEHDTEIIIGNDADSSVVHIYHNGSFFSPLPKGQEVKVDTINVFFTQNEKDTIFSLVNDLIIHPAKPNRFCTDYVGKLELTINSGEQFKRTATYSSVCDWTSLSNETKQLHNLLRRRIENIYLGKSNASHVEGSPR